MEKGYIYKVLSQLKAYKNTKEIEYELFDHIDEHEKFFIDIGYDEKQATQKAEEKMGDADIVAEQFKEVEFAKRNNIFLGLLNVALVLLLPEGFMLWIFPTSYFGLFDAFAIVPLIIVFVLFAIDVFLSIKHKSIWGIIISTIAGVFLQISLSSSYENAVYILNNHNPARLFFEYGKFVFISLSFVFITAQISTVIIKIKTKLQRNRKFDLKFMKAMMAIVAVLSIATLAATSFYLPVLTIKVSDVREELNNANQIAVENINSLVGSDFEGAKAWVEDNFSDYYIDENSNENDITIYDNSYEETCTYYSPNGHISIYISDYDNSVNLHIRNECEYFTDDPDYELDYYQADDYNYMSKAVENKLNAKDIKLIGELSVHDINNPSKANCSLYFGDNSCCPYYVDFEYKNNNLIATELDQIEV